MKYFFFLRVLQMLVVTALTLLVVTAVTARPEPPVGQYLPPDQQYGPPHRNSFDVGGQTLAQTGPSAGGVYETNQYLPPNQQYGPPEDANTAGYNDGFNDVSVIFTIEKYQKTQLKKSKKLIN